APLRSAARPPLPPPNRPLHHRGLHQVLGLRVPAREQIRGARQPAEPRLYELAEPLVLVHAHAPGIVLPIYTRRAGGGRGWGTGGGAFLSGPRAPPPAVCGICASRSTPSRTSPRRAAPRS